jgi:N6-L-threonylcarbamoyladenine synthase
VSDPLTVQQKADVAASAEAAIVDVLVKKSLMALKQVGCRRLVVAGGVGANRHLRAQLNAVCTARGVRVHYPELHLCTDNGAMIALAAGFRVQAAKGQWPAPDPATAYAFDVRPRWPLAELSAAN